VGWKPVFNPINYVTLDITDDISGNRFIFKKLGFIAGKLIPLSIVPVLSVLGLLALREVTLIPTLQITALIYGVLLGMVLCALIYSLTLKTVKWGVNRSWISQKWVSRYRDWSHKREAKINKSDNERREIRIVRKAEQRQREIDGAVYFLCNTQQDKKIKTIADIPKPKRSFKLRFHAVKGMVCKPFTQ